MLAIYTALYEITTPQNRADMDLLCCHGGFIGFQVIGCDICPRDLRRCCQFAAELYGTGVSEADRTPVGLLGDVSHDCRHSHARRMASVCRPVEANFDDWVWDAHGDLAWISGL